VCVGRSFWSTELHTIIDATDLQALTELVGRFQKRIASARPTFAGI